MPANIKLLVSCLAWCTVAWNIATGTSVSSASLDQPGHTYSVFSRDFLNTQQTKICLIARMNASVLVTYTPSGEAPVKSRIQVPATASTRGSVCDYNFNSVLSLAFNGVHLTMYFTRDRVVTPSTQNQYCLRCDVGNWRLVNITLNIDDVSSLHGSARFPPTLLSSWSRTLSSNALALLTGVNVQRSYRCDSQLTAKMTVSRAESLTANQSTSTGQWKVNLDLLHFSVEPFLVNVPNDGQLPVFKDPLLCTDVTVFHVLVILLPLVYFFLFVLICRVRERYGCPPECSREPGKGAVRLATHDELDQKSLSSERMLSVKSDPPPVRITVTSYENPQQPVL